MGPPNSDHSSRTDRAQHSSGNDPTQPAEGSALSDVSKLVPMSCIFYGPEAAVTTFQLSLAVEGRQLGRSQLSPGPILVKGCESRFAIENCETIRLCTPSYYREDGQSLIWDMREGVIANSPQVEERWDDPADLEDERRSNVEMARSDPLAQATGRIAATSLRVRESVQSSLIYGDNCLIWCSSIKPRNSKQWCLWRDSLKSSYDHISTVRDPHTFAQALGAMAFQQKGLLGNAISFRNPNSGYVAQCLSLPVVYGPVVYVDERDAYIAESSSDLEFLVRSIFAKTNEHRHQREYRFAILTNLELEDNTIDLVMSSEVRSSVTKRESPAISVRQTQSPVFGGCLPSPRIRQCFAEWPSTQRSADHFGSVFTSQLRSNFHLAGVHHKNTTKARRAVHTIEDVDFEQIDQAIVREPKSPTDARIVKFTLDAGPGSIFKLYDFGGLTATFRLAKKSGKAVLTASITEPNSGEKQILINNSGFDGSSFLSSGTNQLTLSYTPVNPATTVETDISHAEDTVITITATSEDGTATSSLVFIFDSSLGINITDLPRETGTRRRARSLVIGRQTDSKKEAHDRAGDQEAPAGRGGHG